MLPAAPKTLGRLSDVFISALGAITGQSNRLGFKRATKALVVLVDGLGSENLRAAAGHAPFLNSSLRKNKSINTVFPSTTAAAITSFGVGAKPSQHGVFGYSVYDRKAGEIRNLLSGWNDAFQPESFQKMESVSTVAETAGVRACTVGPGEYEASGFTRLNMADAEYLPAKSFDERTSQTLRLLKLKQRSITYLYFPELDSLAHAYGVNSTEWLNKLEELDGTLKNLASALPADVGMIVTADHGIVDVPRENQILLDELELPGLLAVTGDPRNCFLYFTAEADISASRTNIQNAIQGRASVATPSELQELGWLENSVRNDEFLPDLFVISTGANACYHRGFAKPQSLRMVGQHGGVSQTELSVPLLKFGAFAD
jgi:predicted AlkP superfamily pyrophosphatase or phosphodiesterase